MDTTPDGALIVHAVPPPRGDWQPITPDTTGLIGRRVVLAQPLEWWHDLRAISNPRPTGSGEWVLWVVDEADWYAAGRDPDKVPGHKITAVLLAEVWAG